MVVTSMEEANGLPDEKETIKRIIVFSESPSNDDKSHGRPTKKRTNVRKSVVIESSPSRPGFEAEEGKEPLRKFTAHIDTRK